MAVPYSTIRLRDASVFLPRFSLIENRCWPARRRLAAQLTALAGWKAIGDALYRPIHTGRHVWSVKQMTAEKAALHRRLKEVGASVGDLFLFEDPVAPPESCQLRRSGISGLSKPAQGGVTTIGAFDYFAGDNPTSPVFLTAGRKKQTRPLKGLFHISHGGGMKHLDHERRRNLAGGLVASARYGGQRMLDRASDGYGTTYFTTKRTTGATDGPKSLKGFCWQSLAVPCDAS